MLHPLTGAYLKVERARRHLKELDREVRAFVSRPPYRLSLEIDPATDESVVLFRQVDERPIRLPLALALIAGDVVHNLRSSLDHVAYQLAVSTGNSGDSSQFPIVEARADFARAQDRYLAGVPDGPRLIIEQLQPYHLREAHMAGSTPTSQRDPLALNAYLTNLGRLDNRDKHRLLLNGEVMVPFRPPTFVGAVRAEGTHASNWCRVVDGTEYFRVTGWELLPGATDADVKVNADHRFTVGFGDPVWAPYGQPNDYWSDRVKGFATKADLSLTADAIETIVGKFNAYFESIDPHLDSRDLGATK